MRRSILLAALLAPCCFTSVASGLEPVRIDDTTLFDPATGATLTDVRVEPAPARHTPPARASRSLNDGFAGCSTSDDCAPFDLTTHVSGFPIDLLPEGNYPYDATIHPSGLEVWIPGASGDGVIVIDRASNAVTQHIPTGEYPVSLAFSKDGTMALAPCRDSEVISILSTNTYTLVDSLPVPTNYLGAGNVALDPVSGKFYMVDWYDEDMYEVAADGSAILNQATVGNSLWQLVVAPSGQELYVTDRNTDEVLVVDPATLTVIKRWAVGDDPWGIDVTENGAKVVVACEDSHEAYVIDTATDAITGLLLDASADPRDVDIRDDQATAYVAGGSTTSGNLVYCIDLTSDTVAGSFAVTGSNVNVVAVQAQQVDSPSGVGTLADAGAGRLRAHPSPFRSSTTVRYSLSAAADVRLTVCDVAGRVVRRLDEGRRDAGEHVTGWSGRDERGRRVSDGVYFLRLETPGATTSHKVVRRSE